MSIYAVLLVEDEIGTRQTLCDKILAHPGLSLYAAVGSCAEAINCMQGEPDILVTDLGLPDGSGISLVQAARSYASPIESMVLTVLGDESNVIASIKAGASSYLLKDHGFEHLADSIYAMMKGESIIDSRVARFLLSRMSELPNIKPTAAMASPAIAPAKRQKKAVEAVAQPAENTLSNREIEVLELVAKGLTYAETGHVLDISENTIRAHIRNIYTKLTVNSRFEAVYEATIMGLIDPVAKLVTNNG